MKPSKSTHGERVVKDIKRKTRKQYSAEEKIGLFWMVFAVKTAWQSCAAVKAYPKGYITNGRRTS